MTVALVDLIFLMNSLKSKLKHAITVFLSSLHQLSSVKSVDQLSEALLDLHRSFKKIINWIDVIEGNSAIQTVKFKKVVHFDQKNSKDEMIGQQNIQKEEEGNVKTKEPSDIKDSVQNEDSINTKKSDQTKDSADKTQQATSEISNYKFESANCTFKLIFHERFGLIQVDTGFIVLNTKVMDFYRNEVRSERLTDKKTNLENEIQRIELFLSLYTDLKTRLCDYCLGSDFPEERTLEKDYVGAYHKKCRTVQ